MKKTLLTLALVCASVAAFAQGKVTFGNDSAHLFVIGTPAATDVAGLIPVSPLPSGTTLIAALYGKTGAAASADLTLVTSYALTSANWFEAGRMVSRGIIVPNIPGGSPATFQVVVADVLGTSPALAQTAKYYGASPLITMTPGASLSYPTILTGWAPGNLVIDVVPEPSTFALAGLGAAAMLIFRRRK